jgi:DNA-binding NarL/FixJ family response regulator
VSITVVVADDEPLLRAGISLLLEAEHDISVVGEAGDGQQAIDLAHRLHPDVVVMDLRMPGVDGIAATRALCADRPQLPTDGSGADDKVTAVLVLTTFSDDEAVYGALLAGASGYLLKHAVPADLVKAVRAVASGEAWLDPAVAGRVIKALANVPRVGQSDAQLLQRLTPREREVLILLAEGLSNAEISQRLYVGEGTVKTHVSRVLMKTACRDRAQAIALAYRSGLVVPPRR